MEKDDLEKNLVMPQRIYDRAYDELRELRMKWLTQTDLGFFDDFRSDVFRKHNLFLKSYANLCSEKNQLGVLFDVNDKKFTGINDWAKGVLKGFIPEAEHGIVVSKDPKVAVFKSDIPSGVRNEFDRVVMNVAIKKAFITSKLSDNQLDSSQAFELRKDAERLKSDLSEAFDEIYMQDKGHWKDMNQLTDDFIETLETLADINKALNKASPTEYEPVLS